MEKHKINGFRLDVQGLRAIAVGLVVIYHIWPQALPGGFVGVDVFFVISGYLITCHIRQEIEYSGSFSLTRFYGKRIRRLLPAASLVLVATIIAAIFIAPRFKLVDIIHDTVASTLYLQNWRLLFQSIDYLGAEEAAGPLQHFWSLAIEEQYYIFWPIFLLVVITFCSRLNFIRSALFICSLIFGLSLYASVSVTLSDQTIAYFATHTRIWELALGSLLALINIDCASRALRSAVGWFGLALVLGSAFIFNAHMAFPGYIALFPTLGSVLLLWSGGRNLPHERLLIIPPITFLGDISYSLYLWHWPVIIFAGYLGLESLGIMWGAFLISISVLLSWLTKKYVEDKYRNPKMLGQTSELSRWVLSPTKSPFQLATICMGISLGISAVTYLWISAQKSSEDIAIGDGFPGALVLTSHLNKSLWNIEDEVSPSPELARGDMPSSYSNDCHQRINDIEANGCNIGSESGEKVIVLAGDSHAANWIPAFEVLGEEKNWSIISYTKSGCSLTLVDIQANGKRYTECTEWSRRVLEEINKIGPDLVILGRSVGARLHVADSQEQSDRESVAMLIELFEKIHADGSQVAAIRDTPRMPFDPLLCFEDQDKCSADKSEVLKRFDPLIAATNQSDAATLIDMTDGICRDDRCYVVEGNVIVWRDWHHLTETYSRTLAPLLQEMIENELELRY